MDQSTFLKAIEAEPMNEGLRGVYADWLDEHDRPEEAARQREWVKAYQYVTTTMQELSEGETLENAKKRKEFWRCFQIITGAEPPRGLTKQDWEPDVGYGCFC